MFILDGFEESRGSVGESVSFGLCRADRRWFEPQSTRHFLLGPFTLYLISLL